MFPRLPLDEEMGLASEVVSPFLHPLSGPIWIAPALLLVISPLIEVVAEFEGYCDGLARVDHAGGVDLNLVLLWVVCDAIKRDGFGLHDLLFHKENRLQEVD